MRTLLLVLFVGSCLFGPIAFFVGYVYWNQLLSFVQSRSTKLYDRFGGHGIFRHVRGGGSTNNNLEFFRFMFSREYEQHGPELAQRCRRGMALLWALVGIFGAGLVSIVLLVSIYG